MNTERIYILGGYQTDFARNWSREGLSITDLFTDCIQNGLDATNIDPADIDVGHVGNFVSASYTGQAHLGGLFGHAHPALAYLPASSHEAACASGSMAILCAMADLESGRYGLACVAGIEMMRTSGQTNGDPLAAAAWADKEWTDQRYVWPAAFDQLVDVYDERYGVDQTHLRAISKKNFNNAKRNPNAQSRDWSFTSESFDNDDQHNPVVSGRIRRQDCGQVTDGAVVAFLANRQHAEKYAQTHDINIDDIPYIKGWGHINAPMSFEKKLQLSDQQGHLFPHIAKILQQTLHRAGLNSIEQISGLEVHDCFNITEYMILDHTGLRQSGDAWQLIEEGVTELDGVLPINASGGLIGLGHPVGATGIRMLLDCTKQSQGAANENQIKDANNMMTFNIGGSTTTCASFIVGRDI